jgi:hypothetical protein
MTTAAELLHRLALAQAGQAAEWLDERLAALEAGGSERDLHVFLGLAPRRLGKADLVLTDSDAAQAEAIRPGWRLQGWSLDGAARVLGLLVWRGARPFAETFRDLRRTADAAEAIALYRGLPLYAEPQALAFEAGEALRSAMRPLFEAVAHHSPYPREQFDEHRWNHMVLKALFIGAALGPIQGLDDRANPGLARILLEFAQERRAAGRPVPPGLWRCVGPFAADEAALAALARALEDPDPRPAALALAASPAPGAPALLSGRPEAADIAAGRLTWDMIDEAAP